MSKRSSWIGRFAICICLLSVPGVAETNVALRAAASNRVSLLQLQLAADDWKPDRGVVQTPTSPGLPGPVRKETFVRFLDSEPSGLKRDDGGGYTWEKRTEGEYDWSQPVQLTLRRSTWIKSKEGFSSRLPEAEIKLKLDPRLETYEASGVGLGTRNQRLWLTFEQIGEEEWTTGVQLKKKF